METESPIEDLVTLVDRQDRVVGTAGKMQAHREALLHRACSVVVFNSRGEILLQRRSLEKYHSGGLWSNTCCTHPRPDESPPAAAARRLIEEMGFSCVLVPAFSFLYRAELDEGLVEHEFDHVFLGRIDAKPLPDSREVWEWRWQTPELVRRDLVQRPKAYTAWFAPLFDRLEASMS
jgi:isopentenyl-diphosphate delta-isomerase